MSAARIALFVGAAALALILGALGFQYLGGIAPCEMCQWQRWPHIAAAIVGICGGALIEAGLVGRKTGPFVAALAILLVAASGAIAVFHAGVEWHLWAGPSACTGARVVFNGLNNLNNEVVVRCDIAAWRLFGLSLAGYNAIISLGLAGVGTALLIKRTP